MIQIQDTFRLSLLAFIIGLATETKLRVAEKTVDNHLLR